MAEKGSRAAASVEASIARAAILGLALALAWTAGCAAPALGCQNAPVLHAPERGCIAFRLEVGNDDSCAFRGADGATHALTGSWVRVAHAADRSTTVVPTALSSPLPCAHSDDPSCPSALITRAGAAPCSCDLEGADLSTFAVGSGPVTRVLAPEHDLLLGPPGAMFEVTICVDEADAFPTCSAADGQCDGGGFLWSLEQCTCLPRCRVDADCPQPRTGTARAHCDPMGCVISCAAMDTCPDGQTCVEGPGTPGPVCMAPLFDGAP